MIATYPKNRKVKQVGVKQEIQEVVEGPYGFSRAKLGDSEEKAFSRRYNYYGKKAEMPSFI